MRFSLEGAGGGSQVFALTKQRQGTLAARPLPALRILLGHVTARLDSERPAAR
jgi:hypothetical protein